MWLPRLCYDFLAMSRQEIYGVDLKHIRNAALDALTGYQSYGSRGFEFDLSGEIEMCPTPDKPNSARFNVPLLEHGIMVATAHVIAFAPGDATGDQSSHKVSDVDFGDYLPSLALLPRSKTDKAAEVHLTLASFAIDSSPDPVYYAGSLDLLSLGPVQTDSQKPRLQRIGTLGQPPGSLQTIMADPQLLAGPNATLTCGNDRYGRRFGDPHSVVSTTANTVQVCAFIGLDKNNPGDVNSNIVSFLRAGPPVDLTTISR